MKKNGWKLVSLLLIMAWMMPAFSKGEHKFRGKMPEKKIFMAIHFITAHQEELNISDEQMDQIENIGTETKKQLIRKKADIDTVEVDLRSQLKEDTINQSQVNKLIDQKYELKKEKAKLLVDALVNLKKTLTKEQNEKIGKLMREKMKQMMRNKGKGHCPKMAKDCPMQK